MCLILTTKTQMNISYVDAIINVTLTLMKASMSEA